MIKHSLTVISLLSFLFLSANPRLPKIFGDNMVLQRNRPIPVWGWADPGEKISISLNHQNKSVTADKKGYWKINLDAEPAGGPYQLLLSGRSMISLKNIMVGEVWICSGQSNMEMPIAGWGKINNYQQEIAASDYPLIRQIKVPNTVASAPQDDIPGGEWKICGPETAGEFTAVGYFFARELFKQLHVPIGLINSSWGGTMVETWTSRDAFEQSNEFKSMISSSLPTAQLDSLNKIRHNAVLEKVRALQGDPEPRAITETWNDAAFDDHQWKTIKLPGLWEDQGLGLDDLDGIVWFRKTIELAAGETDKPAVLNLDMIDDNDITYVNGVQVGNTNDYAKQRRYILPAGVLKEGKNTIAVRVQDTGGGGGIYGDGSFSLTVGSRIIPLNGDWYFRVAYISSGGISPNSYPTLLFNAMINPLIPFGIQGAIWYQGEANAGRAYQYRKAFPLMITDWRNRWNEGNFPFYFVQLASFNAGNGDSEHGSTWAELREAQTMTLSLPNTGMTVTTDIGEAHDIHPKNKQDVGRRLASIALNNVYAQPMEFSGPVYESMKIEGNRVRLSFRHTGSGLMVKDKYGYVKGFELAGNDQHFHYAKAHLEGNQVVVYQDDLANPVQVRYNWADDAGDGNLFNQEGFPAQPFRTDAWKGMTDTVKFSVAK
ncbi:MAG: sialate O-acetylesterase [Chitinophagales bacterium]